VSVTPLLPDQVAGHCYNGSLNRNSVSVSFVVRRNKTSVSVSVSVSRLSSGEPNRSQKADLHVWGPILRRRHVLRVGFNWGSGQLFDLFWLICCA
jgi:hypothetical protein